MSLFPKLAKCIHFFKILYCFISSMLKSAHSLKKKKKKKTVNSWLSLTASLPASSPHPMAIKSLECDVLKNHENWHFVWHVSRFKVGSVLPSWDERAPKNVVPFLWPAVGLKCMTIPQTTFKWLCLLAPLDPVFAVVRYFLSVLPDTPPKWPDLRLKIVLYLKGSLLLDSHSSSKSVLGMNGRDFQVHIWQVFQDQSGC